MSQEINDPARKAAIRHAEAIARMEWEGPYIPKPEISDDRKDQRAPRVVGKTILMGRSFGIPTIDEIAGNDVVTRRSIVEMDDRPLPITKG